MKKSLSLIAMSTALLLPTVTAEASQQETNSIKPVHFQVEGTTYKAVIKGQPIRWEGGKWNELDLQRLISQILKSNGQPSVTPPASGNEETQNPVTEKPETGKPEDHKPEAEKPDANKPVEKPEADKPVTEKPESENPDTEKPVQKPEQEPEQKPETEQPSEQPQAKPEAPGTNGQPSTETPAEPSKPQQPAPGQSSNENAGLSATEQKVLDLTNAERTKAGLKPLAADTKLMKSAREKSADMSKNNYFSHTSPTYGSPFDQMKALGISYRSAAENIAMGQRTPEEVVKGWMESPGHRQNILTPGFTHIGIGYDPSGHYWTQQFIQK
ncbi:CAP domain-containing protein [Edaphobacillus lindanitolerans]|uniref:Uncharacterized protein, YkwD family n=1 Tax=Edaphobacillus lindanitolerans TaxID=550447 RepID=A0A1U7PPP8_9BACI|nr:CAP domain-containing protein [Edaphobacillus lindanitolerans]SIT80670.1 uncharacterized protein, YkwD family [Edaphobacillus lindanitolerans]